MFRLEWEFIYGPCNRFHEGDYSSKQNPLGSLQWASMQGTGLIPLARKRKYSSSIAKCLELIFKGGAGSMAGLCQAAMAAIQNLSDPADQSQ
jgi:hypothetical protein